MSRRKYDWVGMSGSQARAGVLLNMLMRLCGCHGFRGFDGKKFRIVAVQGTWFGV